MTLLTCYEVTAQHSATESVAVRLLTCYEVAAHCSAKARHRRMNSASSASATYILPVFITAACIKPHSDIELMLSPTWPVHHHLWRLLADALFRKCTQRCSMQKRVHPTVSCTSQQGHCRIAHGISSLGDEKPHHQRHGHAKGQDHAWIASGHIKIEL